MEDFVSLLLIHFSVDEEARITLFDDLLGQELNSLRAITKDDALIDLQLKNENM